MRELYVTLNIMVEFDEEIHEQENVEDQIKLLVEMGDIASVEILRVDAESELA